MTRRPGGVDERHAGDVDDLDRRIAGQPLGELRRRVAVDLALEDQRPVDVDRRGRDADPRSAWRHTLPSPGVAARSRRLHGRRSSRDDREPVTGHPHG